MSYLRRGLGIVIGFSPVFLAIGSLLFPPRRPSIVGTVSLAIAGLIAAHNLHLAFVRTWLYKRRHSTCEGLRHVSGIPVVASLIILHTVFGNLGSKVIAVAALVILAIDTGGLPWALVAIWKDRGFWESRSDLPGNGVR